ncbi:DUF3108 domain-containing protein [Nitrincola tapanii]|uniref:DUF3108 domain-containing protein n=1 Tax=Nitrincola tapanii TaxID=1708751 RepID=A0A5A9W307_9GAMM|nr:DUF3108 domain-containing protein [Nitrincola tapanii]KAA0875150.1 DUF3108 domain-containing protein [Nitrincola tapanii]
MLKLRLLTSGCTLVFASLISPSLLAASLTPFKATYTHELNAGISVSGEAVRELSQTENGDWLLAIEASAMVASIKETTRFTAKDHQIQPLEYDYQRRVLGKRRAAHLSFDWDSGKVTTDIDNKPWKMNIQPGVHDKLSYQMQLPLDLAQGAKQMRYEVADGGQIQTYQFKVVGEEQIQTPMGDFTAIKVARDRGEGSERETYLWLAPALDYMVVRLHQIESDGKEYSLLLKSLSQ